MTNFIKDYWTNGCHFRRIISEKTFIQVMPESFAPQIELRTYISGIADCFNADNWMPCTQDEFVKAYVTAINAISSASGIEHLPLQMELIDNTQNPES